MAEQIESQGQYSDTPRGWAERWQVELDAARKNVEKAQRQGDKAVKRFLDEQTDVQGGGPETGRLNLFHANVTTQQSMLYGKIPAVEVGRRFADSSDDVARSAAEALERMLNTDIERDSDTFAEALHMCLEDRLIPGLGEMRFRYVVEFEEREVPPQVEERPDPLTGEMQSVELAPGYTEEVKSFEDVESAYVNWKDILRSPARNKSEVRWVAYRAYMSKEAVAERFGKKIAEVVPMKGKGSKESENSRPENDPWQRAEVWEIWDKDTRKVYWYVEGHGAVLDIKDDPLGLEGFFPGPAPMIANTTTRQYVPKPDLEFGRVLYDQIDTLNAKAGLLEDAIRVAGGYDKNSPELGKLLQNTGQNQMIPVENWAMFAEGGGFKGRVEWFPLDGVVTALNIVAQRLEAKIQLLYQITGMSDIMRGSTNATETLGAQQLKAKFASVKVQRLQDEFARFATESQKIKGEIIAKHFDAKTIIERSNIMQTADAQFAEQAVQLIKDNFSAYRIEVKPEAVAMADYAALKSERTEYLGALSTFLPPMIQAAQAINGALPFLLEMLKWTMAGFRGASSVEGILDQAIAAAKKAAEQPEPPKPDPKLKLEETKIKGAMAKTKMQIEGDLAKVDKQIEGEVIKQGAQSIFSEGDTNPADFRRDMP
jgi:uncharacterized protein (UPF0335 family)